MAVSIALFLVNVYYNLIFACGMLYFYSLDTIILCLCLINFMLCTCFSPSWLDSIIASFILIFICHIIKNHRSPSIPIIHSHDFMLCLLWNIDLSMFVFSCIQVNCTFIVCCIFTRIKKTFSNQISIGCIAVHPMGVRTLHLINTGPVHPLDITMLHAVDIRAVHPMGVRTLHPINIRQCIHWT